MNRICSVQLTVDYNQLSLADRTTGGAQKLTLAELGHKWGRLNPCQANGRLNMC